MDQNSQIPPDAIAIAAQIGRLDLISLLLAAIGLILVAGGIFAFVNLRRVARAQAESEAREVAEEVAERVANQYLQRELPKILSEYEDIFSSSSDMSDQIAGAQDVREGE